jgi:hypothetical protein
MPLCWPDKGCQAPYFDTLIGHVRSERAQPHDDSRTRTSSGQHIGLLSHLHSLLTRSIRKTQLQPRDGHVHSLSQSSSLHFNTTFIFTSNDQNGLYAMMQQPTPLHRHSQTGKQPRADPSRSVTVLGHWRRL